jgi:cytochrome P450
MFFGINLNTVKTSLNEDIIIQLIVKYFKAWEYFLIRPSTYHDDILKATHINSIHQLRLEAQHILDVAADLNSQAYFYQHLMNDYTQKDALQLALEMLLAGTDTSSVSTFYAVIAFAEHTDIQQYVANEIITNRLHETQNEDMLQGFIYETLRSKPVGPVVIRRAVVQDTLPNGMTVHPGDGVILHLQAMHHREDVFPDPLTFNPDRDFSSCTAFYPFG